nr:EAL domain-containing protein [Neobacillus sp. Marseille-Q6967]
MNWREGKKLLSYYIILHIIGYYLWLFFSDQNGEVRAAGDMIFSLVAPLLSAGILLIVYWRWKENGRLFWLFLALGCLSFTGATLLGGKMATFSIGEVNLCTVVGVLSMLVAFASRIRIKTNTLKNTILDTCILTTAAITFSWHFIISEMTEQRLIAFPVLDLLLLFGAFSFFYLSEKSSPHKSIMASIFLLTLANSINLYSDIHSLSIMVDPIESISLLFLGIAGLEALGEKKLTNKNSKLSLSLLLPNLSVLLLLTVMVIQKSTSLMIGSAISVLLILIRLVTILTEHQTLLTHHHNLQEKLEEKVGERTEELSSRNQQLVTAVKKMKHMALHDVLSGLPNRRLFLDRLVMAMEEAKRDHYKLAVVYIDLDRFKNINDTLGHDYGDLLLKHVSKQMSLSLRKTDTVSRQGGDEFTLILNKIKSEADVQPLIQRLQSIVSKPISIKGEELNVSMSIGIAFFPKDGKTTDELMKHADMAMYHAKEDGRNNYKFFSKTMYQTLSRKMSLENGLRKAITDKEFVLYYQPQVNTKTGKVSGVEALIRWNSIEAGIVSPREFIPLAEETKLIYPIGEWVLYTACEQAKRWHDAGYSQLKLSVNLSPLQFLHDHLVEMVARVLKETGFNPNFLELEITEAVAAVDTEEAIVKMQELRELGVRLSMDDFGTGYSSFLYLKKFPINSLKIAHPFIHDFTKNGQDQALVETIISLGHGLGLSVIAEGVETKEQVLKLRELQCDEIQGYVYSKPLTVTQFNALMDSRAKQLSR